MTMTKEKVIRGFRELHRNWQKNLLHLKLLNTTQNAVINQRHEKFQILNLCNKPLMMSAKEIDNAEIMIPAKILEWRLLNEEWWEE